MASRKCHMFILAITMLLWGSLGRGEEITLPEPLPKSAINDICGHILSMGSKPLPPAPGDMSVERAKRFGDQLIQSVADALLSDSNDGAEETHFLKSTSDQMQMIISFAKKHKESFTSHFLDELHEYYFILLLELKLREHGRSVTLYAEHYFGHPVEFGENPEFDEVQGMLLSEARDLKNSAGSWEDPDFKEAAKRVRSFNQKRWLAPFDKNRNNGPKPTDGHLHRFVELKRKPVPVTQQSIALIHKALERVNWDLRKFQLSSSQQSELFSQFQGIGEKFNLMKAAAKTLMQLPQYPDQSELTKLLLNLAISSELLKHVEQSSAASLGYRDALVDIFLYNLMRYQYEIAVSLKVDRTNQYLLNFALIRELQSSLFENEPEFNLKLVLAAESFVQESFTNDHVRDQLRSFVRALNAALVAHAP